MSTILDALRKVEEERRASSHSTRERLLFLPQVTPRGGQPLPSPSRKGIWLIGLVLVGAGFAGGVGTTLFRAAGRPPGPAVLIPATQPTPPTTVATASDPLKEPPFLPAPVKKPSISERSLPSRQLSAGLGRPPAALVSKRSERSLPSKAPYKQPQDTLEPQTLPLPSPSGIPKVSLNLLQWSPQANRRLAFISVEGGPMLLVQEGDTISDLTVERILADAVELSLGNSTFVIKPLTNSSLPAPSAP